MLPLYEFLEKADKWIDEIPPIEQPMRFGNKSFRTWYEKVKENIETELFDKMPEQYKAGWIELYPYLLDSFGSYEWIDYGTGHEMNFAVFLLCLFRMGVYNNEDF